MTNAENNAREMRRAGEFAQDFTRAAAAARGYTGIVPPAVVYELQKMTDRFERAYSDAFRARLDAGDLARRLTLSWWAYKHDEVDPTDPVELRELADTLPRPRKR